MHTGQNVRHTRRGFFRGDATPKFFPLVDLTATRHNAQPPEYRSEAGVSLPPELLEAALTGPAPQDGAWLDFSPHPTHLLHHADGSLTAPSGHAFLSFLADQIAGQAARELRGPQADDDDLINFSPADEEDPNIEFLLDEKSLLTDSYQFSVDLSYESEASYREEEDAAEFAHLGAHIARGKFQPRIVQIADGGRVEMFDAGSRLVKDVLGRVIEVQSQYGECLYLRYGVLGRLESFQRLDARGRVHSEGRRDNHGVVVRDPEGRVRAAGESMTIDPRGCFYLHGPEGQYFSLDLATGIHSERRRVENESGVHFVTSLFTHDGFRMATMFGPAFERAATVRGGKLAPCTYRFYGRDGTVIQFASEDDLQDMNPALVSSPAWRKVNRNWLAVRQAVTAWESVHDYLIRVS